MVAWHRQSRVADLMLVRLSMSDTSCLPPHFTPPAFVVLVELVEHNYTSLDPKQQAPLMLAGSNPKLPYLLTKMIMMIDDDDDDRK